MELLGPSLWDVWNGPADQALSEQYVACVAVEALTILEHLHGKGCARQLPRPSGRHVAVRARAGGRPAPPGDRAHTRAPACAPCGAAGRPVLALAAAPRAPRGTCRGAQPARARAGMCTATSSRRTFCWARRAGRARSACTWSTWAWPRASAEPPRTTRTTSAPTTSGAPRPPARV